MQYVLIIFFPFLQFLQDLLYFPTCPTSCSLSLSNKSTKSKRIQGGGGERKKNNSLSHRIIIKHTESMGSYVSHLFLSWPFCHLHCGATGHKCFPRLSLAPGLWQIKFRVSVTCLLNIPVSQSISASNNRLSFKMSCPFSQSHKE